MTAQLTFQSTEIPEVMVVSTPVYTDARGYFTEAFNTDAWRTAGFPELFVQDNLSLSSKGVMRGLHYQLQPHGMGKLVRVMSGAIFDVAVDIRRGSPTFGKWVGRELTADMPTCFWAPIGFAHGFLALCDETRVYYKCTDVYTPEAERSIRYDDPAIGIQWPAPILQLSPKDAAAPLLAEAEYNFSYTARNADQKGAAR